MSDAPRTPRTPRAALVLFAFGDFAFNLYWQSAMLFLLFYYTEALGLAVGWASLTYMAALVLDGVASLAVGVWADRHRDGGYRRYLMIGAAPLGLSFALAYLPPGWAGSAAGIVVFATHLMFRTAYAAVNIPYLAMTARVSDDSGDRALIAGMRMAFGTAAMVTVSLGTVPIGRWLTGSEGAPAYAAAAMLFAAAGTLILIAVARGVPERVPADDASGPAAAEAAGAAEIAGAAAEAARPAAPSLRATFAALAGNRAFVALNAAMVAVIIAATFLSKSVLYYFKYALGDEAAGQGALATMGLVAALAVPVWTLICRRAGGTLTWMLVAVPLMLILAGFALAPAQRVGEMRLFLAAAQLLLIGMHIVFWAMLPNTVEWGARASGMRLEGGVFGLAALLQRIAMGLATGLFGLVLSAIGWHGHGAQAPATIAALALAVALVPLTGIAASVALMFANPLRR